MKKKRKHSLGPSRMVRRPSLCPTCGYTLTGYCGVDNTSSPSEGDLTVCIECHSYLAFGPGLALRNVTDDDFAALPDEQRSTLREVRLTIILATLTYPETGHEDPHSPRH